METPIVDLNFESCRQVINEASKVFVLKKNQINIARLINHFGYSTTTGNVRASHEEIIKYVSNSILHPKSVKVITARLNMQSERSSPFSRLVRAWDAVRDIFKIPTHPQETGGIFVQKPNM